MNNFFLLNEAIGLDELEDFKTGMSQLVSIDKCKEDVFLKHDSVWNLNVIEQLYSNYGQVEQVISIFIEQLTSYQTYLGSEGIFNNSFPDTSNAFLGIDFSMTNIAEEYRILHQESYDSFIKRDLWDITFRNLWKKRNDLFPNLILCPQVENDITKIGNSGYFNQIVDRLTEFDKAVKNWTEGEFSYKHINANYSLRISPESDKTMEKFGNDRSFPISTGGTAYFELHIKTGDLRFHFYPDNNTRKVYIGYIGPHLQTVSN